MDQTNILAEIESLPLPPEVRERALTIARTLSEADARVLLSTLRQQLMDYDESIQGLEEDAMEELDAILADAHDEARSFETETEKAEQAAEMQKIEQSIQQDS